MTEEEKPPVHVKIKVGNLEFEIECREDQVKDMVEKVLSTVTEYASKTVTPPKITPRPVRADTCKGVILRLWREGWFSTPRSLEEVHNEMMRIGFHYDRTAVSHALLDLVRENVITREGKPRRYRYVQKKPPSTEVTAPTNP
ncbi:MAG TPA: hypothetical protein ENF85_00690 [Candidatus Bathyarchaeota archaeon]|nr:MAG: hypothetical protein AYL31_005930 [Candidatus Bathyarchaeota archaeon B26-1]HDJ04493.1 hypothetical protein [Candidatus Bathyarchaeota archaeon]